MLMILFRRNLKFDGMVNVKPTFGAVLDSSLHFDVIKLASVCRIPYVFQLCVCYRLSLILDGFINDLYERSIFCFNGCLMLYSSYIGRRAIIV